MSTPVKPSYSLPTSGTSRQKPFFRHVPKNQAKTSFWRRLDIRFPWLKLIAVLIIGAVAVLDLLDVTISHTGEMAGHIKTAPMSSHIKATERTLKGKKLVALTFDDGPSPANTSKLLDILTEKDATATFFMLGNMAKSNPDLVRQVEKRHYEIASHTMYHQNLTGIAPDAAKSDLDESKSVFKEILGHGPAYVRPPYGNFNDAVASAATRPLILWSVDTEDWLSKNPDAIVATAMSEVYDGAIILMHDIYPTSIDAVSALIDALRAEGYEVATVSELAKIRGTAPVAGGAYYNFRP